MRTKARKKLRRRKLLGLEGTSGGHWANLLFKAGSARGPDQLKAPPSCVSDEEHSFSHQSFSMLDWFLHYFPLRTSLIPTSQLIPTTPCAPVIHHHKQHGSLQRTSLQVLTGCYCLSAFYPFARNFKRMWDEWEEKPSEGLIREKRNRAKKGKEWWDNLCCHLGRHSSQKF